MGSPARGVVRVCASRKRRKARLQAIARSAETSPPQLRPIDPRALSPVRSPVPPRCAAVAAHTATARAAQRSASARHTLESSPRPATFRNAFTFRLARNFPKVIPERQSLAKRRVSRPPHRSTRRRRAQGRRGAGGGSAPRAAQQSTRCKGAGQSGGGRAAAHLATGATPIGAVDVNAAPAAAATTAIAVAATAPASPTNTTKGQYCRQKKGCATKTNLTERCRLAAAIVPVSHFGRLCP